MRTRLGGASKGLIGLAILVLGMIQWQLYSDYRSDDAYIAYRYSRNLASGEGLVFNPGERVEGYSSVLWILLMAPIVRAGLDPHGASVCISLSCLLALIIIMVRDGRRRTAASISDPRLPVGWMAALWWISIPGSAVWTFGGLETLAHALLLTAVALTARSWIESPAAERSRVLQLIVLVVLLGLLRPEGTLLAMILAVAVLGALPRKRRSRGSLRFLLITAVLLVPYHAARTAYFGSFIPNVVHCKVGFSLPRLLQGWRYLHGFFAPLAYLLPLLVAFAVWQDSRHRRSARAWIPEVFLLLASLAIVLLVGGDHMPFHRFLVAPAPLICLMAADGLARAVQGSGGEEGRAALPVFLVVGLIVAVSLAWRLRTPEEKGRLQKDLLLMARWERVGEWLAERYPPETYLAVGCTGIIPYRTGFPTLDMLGLTDPWIAHRPAGEIHPDLVGHDKGDGAYVLRRRPDLILLGNVVLLPRSDFRWDSIPWGSVGTLSEREIWFHPDFHRLYEARTEQVGDRYLYFHVRRGFTVPGEAPPGS